MSAAIGLRDDDRGLVPGRDAGRTEERSGLSVGQKGHATAPAKGSALRKCLSFWRSLSGPQYWNCNHHAACRHRRHAEACRRDQQGCCTRRPRADHSRQGGLAHHAQAQSPGKPHLGSAAARLPGTECGGKHLQYLRQTYLSNRVFENYTAILDACQTAWRSLLNELGRIASIATRRDVDGAVLAPRAFLEARDQ